MKHNFIRFQMALFCLGLMALAAVPAQATHFRYGTLSWRAEPTGPTGQVIFNLTLGYRRSFFTIDYPQQDFSGNVGDIFQDTQTALETFDFGDGTPPLSQLWFRLTYVDITDDWFIAEALDPSNHAAIGIPHTYNPAVGPNGPYMAKMVGCCRLSTLNNGHDESFQLQTKVDLGVGNISPVCLLPPVIALPRSDAVTFVVPANAPAGTVSHFRLSTPGETGNSEGNPPGLTIDPTTGQVSWNTTFFPPGSYFDPGKGMITQCQGFYIDPIDGQITPCPPSLWTVGFMIEALDRNGILKSETPVDVTLAAFDSLPLQLPLATINGSHTPAPITVQAGQPASFTLVGTDPDPRGTITLYALGLPDGATMTPALPFAATQPVQSVFSWTPTADQAGSHVMTCIAIDNLGLQSIVPITLIVNRPPVATCKPATIAGDQNCQAVVLPALLDNGSSDPDGNPITLRISDASNPTPAVSLTLSGSGDHTVTLTVTDNHGGLSTCSTTVTVSDQTPPTITVLGPNPATVECHGSYTDAGATASDACLASIQVPPPSGILDSTTPGIYTLTYTVTGPSGNSASAMRTVRVVDTTPPLLTCPPNQVANATSPAGAHVTYNPNATAFDICDAVVTPIYSPISGSLLPIGDNTVIVNAQDRAGNFAAPCSFTVHVKGASEQISDLIAKVNGLTMVQSAIRNALVVKLNAAQAALIVGNTAAACSDLQDFINLVKAQTSKKLIPVGVEIDLIADATRISSVIGCP